MPQDLSLLPQRLDHCEKQIRVIFNRELKNAISETHYLIASGTPVDTGEARSNWRGNNTIVPTGMIPPHAPGEKLGISETSNLNAASIQVRGALNFWPPLSGSTFYVFNNWRLIIPLNNGTISKQGSHFFDRGVRFARRALSVPSMTGWFR